MFAPHFAEYAIRLAIGLAARADVLLVADMRNVAQECDAALLDEARAASVPILTFDSVGRPARTKSLARIMARIVLFRPHVVHVQEQIDSLTAWVCRLAGPLYPLLLTVHDPRPHSGNDAGYVAENAGNRDVIRAAARGFHVHGPACRAELTSEVGERRPILSTVHGVLFVPRPDETRAPEPRTLLMFGRMEAYKGYEVLLGAVDLLRSRGSRLRLVIAGRGPEAERLADRLAALPAGDEVIARFLSVAEVTALFQRSSLVAVPYLNATQSGVVAAAYGNGRPVVASRTGGLVDAIADGETGLLVPPADPAALADAIGRIFDDPPLFDRLAAGARRAADGAFDWRHIAEKVVAFNEAHLIGRRASSPGRRGGTPPVAGV